MYAYMGERCSMTASGQKGSLPVGASLVRALRVETWSGERDGQLWISPNTARPSVRSTEIQNVAVRVHDLEPAQIVAVDMERFVERHPARRQLLRQPGGI